MRLVCCDPTAEFFLLLRSKRPVQITGDQLVVVFLLFILIHFYASYPKDNIGVERG